MRKILYIYVRGIKETADYGLDVSDSIRGRIQENILAIYDWFCGSNINCYYAYAL